MDTKKDVSQGVKATGGTEGAAALNDPNLNPPAAGTQSNPPTPTGPKASDIPASTIVGADGTRLEDGPAQPVPQSNEYTLSQPHLMAILGQHFGINTNAGQSELRFDEATSALVLKHTL